MEKDLKEASSIKEGQFGGKNRERPGGYLGYSFF
jgi:hypothetical protein